MKEEGGGLSSVIQGLGSTYISRAACPPGEAAINISVYQSIFQVLFNQSPLFTHLCLRLLNPKSALIQLARQFEFTVE